MGGGLNDVIIKDDSQRIIKSGGNNAITKDKALEIVLATSGRPRTAGYRAC